MRHPLRRITAVLVALSVLSFTLGLARVACDAMGGRADGGATMQHATTHHDAADGEDCGQPPAAPGEHAAGMATCMAVAHCGTTMVVADVEAPLVARPVASRLVPADDAGARAPILAPDPPPPRA